MDLPRAPLLLPPDGDRELARLRQRVRLLGLRVLMGAPLTGLEPALARRISALRRDLEGPIRRSPQVALAAAGTPDVLAPLLSLGAGLAPPAALWPRLVPDLLAAWSRFPDPRRAPILWDWPVPRVVDLAAGRVVRPPGGASGALLTAEGLELRVGGQPRALSELPGERRFHPIAPGIHLATCDTNPLAGLEEHPDKSGNDLDLGGRSPAEWTGALAGALRAIGEALPSLRAELPAACARLLPVGYQPERHLSASYREAPGLAYLSLHPDPLTLAEAIIHESQHNKLNLLALLTPPLVNGQSTWTASPVRPDLRPLDGVLLAVHAFVPVAALHERLAAMGHPLSRSPRFAARRHEVLSANARGVAVLAEQARPTAAGAPLLRDLYALHRALVARAPEAPAPDTGGSPPG